MLLHLVPLIEINDCTLLHCFGFNCNAIQLFIILEEFLLLLNDVALTKEKVNFTLRVKEY